MRKFLASIVILAAISALIYYKVILVLVVWGLIEIIVNSIYKRKFFKASLGLIGELIFTLLILFDICFNVVMSVPMNRYFIQKKGYQFGDKKDTISRVLGINERDNTLKKTGSAVCKFLNFIEKDHCRKSI